MKGKWLITEDRLYKRSVKDGSVTQWDRDETLTSSEDWTVEGTNETPLYKFRMLDGDDIVYYLGLCDDNNSENAFRPLDEFGGPNAGCTSIQYKVNGQWETL